MAVAWTVRVRLSIPLCAAVTAVLLCASATAFAGTDASSAEANRKKPLQRCDQLKDKAELECLNKARERVVDARKKRQSEEEKSRSR
jgi:hypothetical protein